jgi:hypothetical protein
MFRLRLILVFLVALLPFSFFLLLNFFTEEERTTKQYFSKYKLEFKTANEELGLIKHGIESIRNDIGELKRQRRPRVEFKTANKELGWIKHGIESIRNDIGEVKRQRKPRVEFKKRTKVLPKWIERFATPHWSEFRPWRGVFVFFVTYRYAYLRKCLESIAFASADIDKSSVCIFALDRTPVTTAHEVNETLEVIRNVTFCKVVVWAIEGRSKEKNYALRLKGHWWFVLESVFNATISGMYTKGGP